MISKSKFYKNDLSHKLISSWVIKEKKKKNQC